MKQFTSLMMMAVMTLALGAGCSSYRQQGGTAELEQDAQVVVNRFQARDSSMQAFFDDAVAYAVFPRVVKGGVGVGGAGGRGVVYSNGQVLGYSELTQGTVGAQLGGQTFSQIIFFEDDARLRQFQQGNVEFSAQASAVAAAEGAARTADYSEGVAVFTMPTGGLMFEASIGGQRFRYWSREQGLP